MVPSTVWLPSTMCTVACIDSEPASCAPAVAVTSPPRCTLVLCEIEADEDVTDIDRSTCHATPAPLIVRDTEPDSVVPLVLQLKSTRLAVTVAHSAYSGRPATVMPVV